MDHTAFPRQFSLKHLPPVPPHDAPRKQQNERKHANDQLNDMYWGSADHADIDWIECIQ